MLCCLAGRVTGNDGDFQLTRQRPGAAYMVGMLVADENRIQINGFNPDGSEPAQGLTSRKTCINEQSGSAGFDKKRITFTAAGKQANPHAPS
jgi:hypothetical protein